MKSQRFFIKRIFILKITLICLFLFISTFSNSFSQSWDTLSYVINGGRNAIFFADPNTGYCVGNSFPTIIKTTTGGNSWSILNPITSAPFLDVFFINANTGYLVGGTTQTGGIISKTTNGGINWTLQTPGTDRILTAVHFFDANTGIISSKYTSALDDTAAFLITNNGGSTWNKIVIATGIQTHMNGMSFPSSSIGFAAGGFSTTGTNPNIFMSNTGGLSWLDTSPGINGLMRAIHFPDINNGYAVGNDPSALVVKTTNSGFNWTTVSLGTTSPTLSEAYFISANTGFVAGGTTGGTTRLYQTTDGGANWVNQSSTPSQVGLVGLVRSIFFINQNTGWICGSGNRILKSTNGGGTVGVSTLSSEIPNQYTLKQNYPNPFNPSTKIDFSIVKKGFVSLTVYNMQGKEIAALVKNVLLPGIYSYEFTASDLSSGVYFYKLQSGDFIETKKMLLVK
jgi:photosystem II stability/assembly factor-like uncharacterized protein